jgi:hypothetical protein
VVKVWLLRFLWQYARVSVEALEPLRASALQAMAYKAMVLIAPDRYYVLDTHNSDYYKCPPAKIDVSVSTTGTVSVVSDLLQEQVTRKPSPNTAVQGRHATHLAAFLSVHMAPPIGGNDCTRSAEPRLMLQAIWASLVAPIELNFTLLLNNGEAEALGQVTGA